MSSQTLAGLHTEIESPDQLEVRSGNPLGTSTKSTSAAPLRAKSQPREKEPRYDLLDAAQELLSGERVGICHHHRIPGVEHIEVYHNPETGKAHYGALMKCGSVWSCPICAAKITEERRKELRTGLSNCTNRMILVTYTLQHEFDDPLFVLLKGLKLAFGKMRSGRKWQNIKALYGVVGGILTTEVTFGENGWHVHRHELLLLPDDITDDEIGDLERLLKKMWLYSLEKCGMSASWDYGLDVNADPALNREYIAKYGRDPVLDEWTVAHELTKNTFKEGSKKGRTPWQLLNDYSKGDLDAGVLFREYALTFKGSKQLQWSNGLRDYLGLNDEIPDEEIEYDETEIDEVLLYEINIEVWRKIIEKKLRWRLLHIASAGNKKKLEKWIERNTGLKTVRIDLRLYG